jgi:hypothetical protein
MDLARHDPGIVEWPGVSFNSRAKRSPDAPQHEVMRR